MARILLGVSAGIASYKSADLASRLAQRGDSVRTLMTPDATRFIRPLTFRAVTGQPVATRVFDDEDPDASMEHIELAQWGEILVIAPATADLIGRLAAGLADDIVTTTTLAFPGPVLVAPAMNDRMWSHPLVRENVERLRSVAGYRVIDPDAGHLACGTIGPGRLPETDRLVAEIDALLGAGSRAGRAGRSPSERPGLDHDPEASGTTPGGPPSAHRLRFLILSGPTREPIDPVRFLSNASSGRQGHELALAAATRGHEVTLVQGPVCLSDPPGVEVVQVVTARDMLAAAQARVAGADVVIGAAAVSDYGPAAPLDRKRKRHASETWTLELLANPDILAELARTKGDRLHVGFALETDDLTANAAAKLQAKRLDWIVANSPAAIGADRSRYVLLEASPTGDEPLTEDLGELSKRELAESLLDRVEARRRSE